MGGWLGGTPTHTVSSVHKQNIQKVKIQENSDWKPRKKEFDRTYQIFLANEISASVNIFDLVKVKNGCQLQQSVVLHTHTIELTKLVKRYKVSSTLISLIPKEEAEFCSFVEKIDSLDFTVQRIS